MKSTQEAATCETSGSRQVRQGVADPRIGSVYATAIRTYRRRFGAVALAAVIIFVPLDVLSSLMTPLAERLNEARDATHFALFATSLAMGAIVIVAGSTIFGGVIEGLAAAEQEGDKTPLRSVLRRRPVVRLTVAGILVAVLAGAGLALFILPGLIVLVLLAIVGPVLAGERLGVFAALRRSVSLTRRHFLLVAITVTIPIALESAPVRLLEGYSWFDTPLVSVPIDVLSTIVLGGVVGMLEGTLTHALRAEDRRRLLARAPTASPADEQQA
jgi:hypothetical protein